MAINWQVRSVNDSTIDEIKSRAKNRGLSIGQYLDWHFTQDIDMVRYDSSKKEKEYKICLPVDAMNNLKRLAANEGYGVAKYLQNIVTKTT
jgi:predicted DNA binding CopG/RHH family protein